jgi:glycosyltransferase involved in cell wall biosynthesis
VEARVDWLGQISEGQKRENYARAVGVIFPPVDEDYGYITLEAMLSSKAVVTCEDSGGPLEFVSHRKTGLVTKPTAAALAEALDELWQDRSLAVKLGRAGRENYERLGLSWSEVVKKLLA